MDPKLPEDKIVIGTDDAEKLKKEMLIFSNPFYKNPEANARQLLQQHMMTETQNSIQKSLMEFIALRSLLSQGHLCFCIPLGSGFPFSPFLPLPQMQETSPPDVQKEIQKSSPGNSHEPSLTKVTKLHISLNSDQQKKQIPQKPDEFKFRPEAVEIMLDLRSILPAEVLVNVEEKSIRVEANHVGKEGIKNYWRCYDLPACVQAESAKCLLTHDGFLHLSVPWYKMEQ